MKEINISLENAAIWIREAEILSSVNFTIESGDVVRLKGANGSGKTVLINTILGFNRVKSGQFHRVFDRKNIVYIPDSPFFFDDEPIVSILKIYRKMYKVGIRTMISILASLDFPVELKDRRFVSELSQGMRKKLVILPLFFAANQFLILDEVFTGLDLDTQIALINRIKSCIQAEKTIIMVEHNESIMEAIRKGSAHAWKEYLCLDKTVRLN